MCKIVFDIKNNYLSLFLPFLFRFLPFFYLLIIYLYCLIFSIYFFYQLNQLSQYNFDKIFLPDSSTFHKTCI